MPSGGVKFPTDLVKIHGAWLVDIERLIEEYHSGASGKPNPFIDEKTPTGWNYDRGYSSDSSDNIREMRSLADAFDSLVSDINAVDEYRLGSKSSRELIDSVIGYDSGVDPVAEHEAVMARRSVSEELRSLMSHAALNGYVESSAFLFGQAIILAKSHSATMASCTDVYADNGAAEIDTQMKITSLYCDNLFAIRALASEVFASWIDNRRIELMVLWEALDRELSVNIKEALWPFKLYQYGANVMTSMHGTVVSKGARSQTQPCGLGVVTSLLAAAVGIGGMLAT